MERIAAIKKLGKLLGKNLGYRVDPKAPTAEERLAAKALLAAAVARRDEISKRKDERYRAILAADPEYQALKAAHKGACDHVSGLQQTARLFKITVGITNSMFFHVRAEGDSWEEVIRKVEKAA